MKGEKFYLVDEETMRAFVEAFHKMCALNEGGVDNWSWYGESLKDYLASWDCEGYDWEEFVEEDMKKQDELIEINIGDEAIYALKNRIKRGKL